MNVGELKKMLEQYPEDMEIVNERCSDYQVVSEDEWAVVKGVPANGPYSWSEWVMRSHATMSEENKAKEKEYLRLEGN